MSNPIALFPLLAPAALALVGVLALRHPGLRPRWVLRASRVATIGSLLLAAAAGAVVAAQGALTSPVLGVAGVGLAVRLDALSAVMFALVALMGVVVVGFSRNYLDGDARQGAFVGGLCATLAAVSLLVIAGNLFQLVAAWIATAIGLQRLLLFYRDRPVAAAGARKKAIVSRIGEAALAAAAVLIATTFGTADIAAILEAARAAAAAGEVPAALHLAAGLVVVAAMTASAQFPTHGWLAEVMETPTPVSALLHAGIINAGTFLVVRLGEVMLLSGPALYLLVAVGAFTALFASVIMVTQPAVKISLAYSSVAHMGFMLLLCGMGAFSVAILHLVAHSFYKAHAFLSSGSVVDAARASWVPATAGGHRPLRIVLGFALALATFAAVAALLGVTITAKPTVMALGALFVLGITHLLAQALEGRPTAYLLTHTWLAAAATALAFVALEIGAAWVLADAIPAIPQPDGVMMVLMGGVVLAFAGVSVLQLLVPAGSASPAWRAAYVHASNGFYVNARFDRLVGALRRSPSTPS